MASLGILTNTGDIQYIPLVDPNDKDNVPAEETFTEAVESEEEIRKVIDIDAGTIRDPGYVNLEELTALANVQPDVPDSSSFLHTPKQVTFTSEEKTNLQALIKKLASVAHSHGVDENGTVNEPPIGYTCSNSICSFRVANSNNSNNSDNGDNGWNW